MKNSHSVYSGESTKKKKVFCGSKWSCSYQHFASNSLLKTKCHVHSKQYKDVRGYLVVFFSNCGLSIFGTVDGGGSGGGGEGECSCSF